MPNPRIDYRDIKIKSPYEILGLRDLEIVVDVNKHVILTFTAVVSEEKGKKHVTTSKHTDKIKIEQYSEGKFVKTLFSGQLYDIDTEVRNDVHYLRVEARSYTYDMDIEKKRRSFQEPGMTYEAMIHSTVKDYNSPDFLPIACEGKNIEVFTLQYDETDWEFQKRMASRFNSVLIPEGRHDSPKFWFGLPEGDYFDLDEANYTISKVLNPYRDSTRNYDADVSENDFITYEIESPIYMYPGDNVTINKVKTKIAKSVLRMEEGVLRLRYALALEDGIRQNLIRNRRIIGLSIEGTVIDRRADEIKIVLDIDKQNPDCGTRWFKYESNYTVNKKGNEGWYVMPEMGHFVALFMPDELEEHAHAVRSIRRNGDTHPKTQDPRVKILGTHHYKELRMDNEQLKFTVLNNDKTKRFMHLQMQEGKGIEILSDRGIDVYSKEDINILAGKVKLRAEKGIIFNNQEGSVIMEGSTHFRNMIIDKKTVDEGELQLQKSKKAAIMRSVAGFKSLGNKASDMGQTEACADPVDVATGNYYIEQTDMILRGKSPVNFVRYYNALDEYAGPLGKNWHHNFDIELTRTTDKVTIVWGDGRREEFSILKSGLIISDSDNQVIERSDNGGYVLKSYKGIVHKFDNEGRLVELNERGNIIKLRYDSTDRRFPKKIESSSGAITLSYYNGILRKITDPLGRHVDYDYSGGVLTTVRNINGGKTHYEYDSDHQITKVTDPSGNTMVENLYDPKGRIIEQIMPMGTKVYFAYDDEANTTTFTERNAEDIVYQKDTQGRIIEKQNAAGFEKMGFDTSGSLTVYTDKNGNTYKYSYGNTYTAIKPNGDKTEITYDDNGNIISEKYPDGSIHQYSYDSFGQVTSYTNPLGHVTGFEYDSKGNLIAITLPDGSQKTYTHDARGNIISYKDDEGNVSALVYDAGNRMTSHTKPQQNKTGYVYNDIDKISEVNNPDGTALKRDYDYCGLLRQETDEVGGVTRYEYLPNSKVAKKTDALDGVTLYDYDVMDNLIAITNPDGSVKQYRYDEVGNRTVEIDEDEGRRHFFYDSNGNVIKEADSNGNATRYEYDSLNRVVKEIDANLNETTYEYNHDDKITKKTDAMGGVTENQYDLCGRLVSTKNPLGAETRYEYSALGYLTKETNAYGAETRYGHNKNGNVTKKIHPDGSFETMEYDGNGNLITHTDASGSTTAYEYDPMDRVCVITNALGGRKEIGYDPTGKVSYVKDENGNTTAYSYDLNQNLVRVTNAKGHSTNYKYDAMNRLTEVHQHNSLADSDTSNSISKELLTQYKYNRRGLVVEEINAKNQVVYFEYDSAGNLISKEDRDGYISQFAYDAVNNIKSIRHINPNQGNGSYGSNEVSYKYDPLNRVISMLDHLGETSYERDILGRIVRTSDHNNSVIRYAYGLLNEKKAIDYPNSSKAEYIYDIMGRLQKVSFGESASEYSYHPTGTIAKETLPNGQTSHYTYDPLRRIKALTHFNPAGEILDNREFTYDPAGNKTQISIKENKPANGSFKQHTGRYCFTFDSLNQLTSVTNPTGETETYSYDGLGNRVSKTASSGSGKISAKYVYDELNRLTQITGLDEELMGYNLGTAPSNTANLAYDNRGNLTRVYTALDNKTISKYTYDAANKLIHSQVSGHSGSYAYNGAGQRVRKEIDGSNYEYVVDVTTPYNDVLSVWHSDSSGDIRSRRESSNFIYGTRRIGTVEADGKVSAYYLHDEMNSPIRAVKPNGESMSQYSTDTFGQAEAFGGVEDGIHNLLTFTGYEDDAGTHLHFVQARYYLPGIGRFTQEDPYKGNVFTPASLNPYMHCYNNPLRYVDLDGCAPVDMSVETDSNNGGGVQPQFVKFIDMIEYTNNKRRGQGLPEITFEFTDGTRRFYQRRRNRDAQLAITVDGRTITFNQVHDRDAYLRSSDNEIFYINVSESRSYFDIHRLNAAFGFTDLLDYVFVCANITSAQEAEQRRRDAAAQRAADLERQRQEAAEARRQREAVAAAAAAAEAERRRLEEEAQAETSQMMINVLNDTTLPASADRREAMAIMGNVLLNAGFEPAFVAGMLANIMREGSFGQFEGVWRSDEDLPSSIQWYLAYAVLNHNYRQFGNQIITNFSLSEVQEMINAITRANANITAYDRTHGFGLGVIQWTRSRSITLFGLYLELAGGNDRITIEQVIEAESRMMSNELSGAYARVVNDWRAAHSNLDSRQAAGDAGYRITRRYTIPAQTATRANQRRTDAELIFDIMMQ